MIVIKILSKSHKLSFSYDQTIIEPKEVPDMIVWNLIYQLSKNHMLVEKGTQKLMSVVKNLLKNHKLSFSYN